MQGLDKKGSPIYLSTTKRKRREVKIKKIKENSLSEAYVGHSLFPFLYTFFSSLAVFRNGALWSCRTDRLACITQNFSKYRHNNIIIII